MKGKLHRVGKLLVLSLVSAGLLMPVQAKAAEYKCEATLPVEVREEGSDIPQGTEYTVRIKALDEAPIPEEDRVTITGEGKAELGPITYTVPEDYCYEVWQEADDRDHFTFDDTVYTVTVRVTNTQEGGLEAQIWAIREGEEAKSDEIVFENRYHKPSKPWYPGEDEEEDEDTAVPVTAVQKPQTPAAPIQVPTADPQAGGTSPQTGDEADLALWTSTAGIGAVLLAAVLLKRRKREGEG